MYFSFREIIERYNLASIRGEDGLIGYDDNEAFTMQNCQVQSGAPPFIEMEGYSLEDYGVESIEELMYHIGLEFQENFKHTGIKRIEGDFFIGFDDGIIFKAENCKIAYRR